MVNRNNAKGFHMMTTLPIGAKVSPLRLGVLTAGTMLMGLLWRGVLLNGNPSGVWLLCLIPLTVGLFVQAFVRRHSGIYLYYTFVFLLNMTVFAVVLWHALLLGTSNSAYYGPAFLVGIVCCGGLYGGYEYVKNTQKQSDSLNSRTGMQAIVDEQPVAAAMEGKRATPPATRNFWDRIRSLTPLFVAIGLNSAYLLSQQAIYWLFGGFAIFSCVTFALASGATWCRTRAAIQAERTL